MNKYIYTTFIFMLLGITSVGAKSQKKNKINIDSLKTVVEHLSQESDNEVSNLIATVKRSRKQLKGKYQHYLHLLRKYIERDSNPDNLAKIYYRLGIDFRYKHSYDSAMIYYEKALSSALKVKDLPYLVKLYNEMGVVCRKTDRNEEAIHYFVYSIEYCDKYDNHYGKAIAENGIGNIYLVQKEYRKALEYFRVSLKHGLLKDNKFHEEISYGNLGETFMYLNQPDSAKYYLNKSLELSIARKNPIGQGICYQLIGQVYMSQGQNEKALEYFKKALTLQRIRSDKRYLSSVLIYYGEACAKTNQLVKAEKSLLEGVAISKEIHSVNNLIMGNAVLYKIYYENKKYKKAFDALLQNKLYTDTLYNSETIHATNDLEFKYQSDQKNHKIELLNAQNKLVESNSKAQQILFITILFLVGGLAMLFYYRYMNRKKITKELQNINRMKSQFFSNVSHEFRTPLTLIQGPITNIIEETENSQTKAELEVVLRNSNRLLALVDQLLNLSKIDAGYFTILAQESDLCMHLRGISNSFNYIAKQRNITYVKNICDTKNVWFDANIIEIIVTNLLSNAFKYVHDNGAIAIETKVSDNSCEITISNSNCELDNRELNYLFNRFYRADKTGNAEGTGIGLALVKELCALYNANIKVRRNAEGVIFFTLEIPTNFEHFTEEQIALIPIDIANPNKTVSVSSLPMQDVDHSDDTPILLIVEDNTDMRQYIRSYFHKQYRILEARDGVEGVEIALEQIPDLIISDVMMPRLDGIGLCQKLKTDVKTNHIPLLLLTAKVGDDSTIKGLSVGADDYIAKPFNAKTLIAKVSNLIATRNAMREKLKTEMVTTPLNVVLESKDEIFAQNLQKVMDANISNPDFDVELFCREMMMSRTQLHRKLKAITGLSTSAFIRVHRIKKAAETLKTKDVNIADVCYATGFNTTSYFSKCFKEVMGITPSEYVKENRR